MDISTFRVKRSDTVDLTKIPTNAPKGISKSEARERVAQLTTELEELQYLLYADHHHKVLAVIQATDTGGKDGTIRNVFGACNPQGVRVTSFKAPSEDELAHDYLWRVHPEVPGTGELVVFNRSHYEDVLIVRVHDLVPPSRWKKRYQHIVDFERLLTDEGTTIVKFYLHISKGEQKERLQARLDDPTKNWKFAEGDLAERKRWDDYQAAFTDMLNSTSTSEAPWYVIPADNKWYRDLVVAEIMVQTLRGLDMTFPPAPPNLAGIVVE